MRLAASLFAALIPFAVSAQTAPSPTQIARYQGLHLAAHIGDAAEIARLANAGADLDRRDSQGRTAVHIAAFASHEDAIGALALAGADMNALENAGYDAVTIAAVADDLDMLDAALNAGNRADLVTSVYDGTALIAAAHLGHAAVVQRLIEAGAPLDHVNNLGWTALIESVVLGDGGPAHWATAGALLDAGADPNIPDRNGATPLALARTRGYDKMAAMIAAAGGRE